jgi:hypothetical protein
MHEWTMVRPPAAPRGGSDQTRRPDRAVGKDGVVVPQ